MPKKTLRQREDELRSLLATPAGRIELAFRLCTARTPGAEEVRLLEAELERQAEHFRKNPEAAKGVFKGSVLKPAEGDLVAAAAWTMLSNILINLDETLTKE